MNDTATSIESRFEGHDVLEAGVAQIPNMLIQHYHHLGLSDGQFTLLCHILSRKWTKEAPYPSITGIRMSANVDTRRRYIRDLRQRGLLFTSRLYWTKEDMATNPIAYPGRVRSNLWYLGSLLHNLARIDSWLKAGNSPESFQVEIPLTTVRMFLKGDFHDTPEEIAKAIQEQTKNGTVLKAVTLVCENDIVEPSMRKASTRKTSTRKSHSLKEESDSNKNQSNNKNQLLSANAEQPPIQPALTEEFTLEPDTPEVCLIFQKVNENRKANGRGPTKRFKSIEQKKKCLLAIARLGPTLEEALTAGMEQGITELKDLTNWIAKYGTNNGKGFKSYGRKTTQGNHRTEPTGPPVSATGLGEWTEDEKREYGFS